MERWCCGGRRGQQENVEGARGLAGDEPRGDRTFVLTEEEESGCLGDFGERKLCVEVGKMQESLTGLGAWGKSGVPGTRGGGWELKMRYARV